MLHTATVSASEGGKPPVAAAAGLLELRGAKLGRDVQLTESEVKGLCAKSRGIFISQPSLLELEAPLKVCGPTDIPMPFFPNRTRLRVLVRLRGPGGTR